MAVPLRPFRGFLVLRSRNRLFGDHRTSQHQAEKHKLWCRPASPKGHGKLNKCAALDGYSPIVLRQPTIIQDTDLVEDDA